MEKCLETADLSPTTRANVDSALTSGKPILAADRAALKAAHDKMETDLSNGADKAVLGLDVLDLDAARTKMKTDAATIHDQLLAQLSADEQQALQSCVSAAHHSGRGPAGATESATP